MSIVKPAILFAVTGILLSAVTTAQARTEIQNKGSDTLVFIGGIYAIVFVLGIFVFVTKEGVGFILDTMDFKEFFTSPYWEPSDEDAPNTAYWL
jgi:ABC-type phosphate transport system permease subunit